MTKPGSGSPDQGANQDDAVWLDLVARLEEGSGAGGAAGTGTGGSGDSGDSGDSARDKGATGAPSPSATFRDFDPLGLAGTAPTELSAAERLASAPGADEGADSDGPGQPGSVTGGPRDYEAEDDDGAFVPEEPPSLAETDPLTMLAWLGAVGAPIALVLSAMFWRSAPVLAVVGMVAVFVLAVVYLVMKLPQEKDENDDGARV